MWHSTIIFILISLVSLSFAQNSGWIKLESGTDAQLNKIFFVDAETGWVVGDNVILGTSNSGDSWTIQNSSDCFFRSLYFTDKNHGWAVGFLHDSYDGIIYQTNDGGLNWQAQDTTDEELIDVFFVDADTGFICGGTGDAAFILKSTNGGTTWDINLSGAFGSLHAIHFTDPQHGWAVGKQGVVLITENSGKIWNRRLPNLNVGYSYLYDVQFVNQDTGWCLGANYFFESRDGGENWELRSNLNLLIYTAIQFHSSEIVWLLGSDKSYFNTDKIFYSSDGCLSWQIQDSLQTGDLTSLYFFDDKVGWVVGTNGLILRTTNGGITSVLKEKNRITSFKLNQNYPNPFNPNTVISYQLPVISNVTVSIYDLLGQKVATLVSQKQKSGHHQVQWDASGFSSGIYLYRIKAGFYTEIKKMVLAK